MVKFTNFYKF